MTLWTAQAVLALFRSGSRRCCDGYGLLGANADKKAKAAAWLPHSRCYAIDGINRANILNILLDWIGMGIVGIKTS